MDVTRRLRHLAVIALQREFPIAAQRISEWAVKLQPRSSEAWSTFSRVVRSTGWSSDQVEALLRRGIRRVRKPGRLYVDLIALLLSEDRADEAQEAASALKNAGGDVEAWSSLAEAYLAEHRADWTEVRRWTQIALQQTPPKQLGAMLIEVGLLLLPQPDNDNLVIEYLKQGVARHPTQRGLITLAALLERRRRAGAKGYLRQARERFWGEDERFEQMVRAARHAIQTRKPTRSGGW
jgi:hypothetical protein